VTTAELDHMIDRLCSYWPTSNIARNTLKNGWAFSSIICEAPVQHRETILAKCKKLPNFPTLAAIEKMLMDEMGRSVETRGRCRTCFNNSGWVYPAETKALMDEGNTPDSDQRSVIRCPDCG
jgi:hypothetical protein